MQLYNTLTRKVQEFKPLNSKEVGVYSCGPTVYDHAHIGNLAAYIFADTLRRTLTLAGFKVHHVMNYTDVDDKTIRRSERLQASNDPRENLKILTDEFIRIFLDDMMRIGNDISAIDFVRATDYIPHMQKYISSLVDSGVAYLADDGIYFSIKAYTDQGKKYGQLIEISPKNTSEARINNDEYDKAQIHDFALWKKKKTGEPSWDFRIADVDMSGRPGWHIECSVMSLEKLGQPFDIHTGGVDLIFPHHENEIAQSTALSKDNLLASFFVHNEHVLVEGRKMSKSAQNFYTLQDLIEQGFEPLCFRLLVLSSHYRSQVSYSEENLIGAYIKLLYLREFAQLRHQKNLIDVKYGTITAKEVQKLRKEFLKTLFDDLHTPTALGMINTWDHDIRRERLADGEAFEEFNGLIKTLDDALGLNLMLEEDISGTQKALIKHQDKEWRSAKESRDFSKADELREALHNQGLIISNYNENGPLWTRTRRIENPKRQD